MGGRAMSKARAAAAAASAPDVQGHHPGTAPLRSAIGRLRTSPIAAGIALLVVTRVYFWRLLPYAAEDAYITFRYARHLARGDGLVFNLNEPVMGMTSAPWTLWTALGIALFRDPVLWTRVSSLALDAVTLAGATALLDRHAGRAAAWCFAIFFAAWPFFGALAASGLEMNAMLALMATAAWLCARRSPWSGPVLGLLALIRPEGVVAAAVIAWWAPGRARWIALAIFATGTATLWSYFGTAIPQSLTAKARLYGTPGPWAGRYWWDWLIPTDLGQVPAQQEAIQLWPLRVLMAPAAALGAWTLRRSPAIAFALASLAVLAGYASLGVAYFYWYFALPAIGIAYLAAAGLPRLLRGRWVYVSIALFILGIWTIAPERSYVARARVEARLFGSVASELHRRAQAGQSVLLEPLGMIGWRNADLRLIDEVGLVSPRVAARRGQGAGWYTDLVAHERPDWLVVRQGLFDGRDPFTGASAFRDSADMRDCFAPYAIAYETARPPGDTDLILLQRTR
jgi:hypothetical protein